MWFIIIIKYPTLLFINYICSPILWLPLHFLNDILNRKQKTLHFCSLFHLYYNKYLIDRNLYILICDFSHILLILLFENQSSTVTVLYISKSFYISLNRAIFILFKEHTDK